MFLVDPGPEVEGRQAGVAVERKERRLEVKLESAEHVKLANDAKVVSGDESHIICHVHPSRFHAS